MRGRPARPRMAPWLLAAVLGGASVLPVAAQEKAPRSLSLEEALALALPASDAVALATADLRRAEGEVRRIRADLLPQLTGTAGYTRTIRSQFGGGGRSGAGAGPAACDRFTANPGLTIDQRVDSLERAVACLSTLDPFGALRNLPFGRPNQYSFGLQFSQTLFSSALFKGRPRAAVAGRRLARLGLTSAEAQTRLEVTEAYLDAGLADRLAAIAELSLAQAETTLAQTALARQVGTRAEFDLLRARVARDNQHAAAIQRRSQRELAHLHLLQKLGLPLDTPLQLTTTLDEAPPADLAAAVESGAATLGDTAVEQRAAVRQADEAATIQEVLTGVTRWDRLPTVVLTSRLARIGYPDDGQPWHADYLTDWTVGVGLSVPLWTSGRLGGNSMVAEAALEQARVRTHQARDGAALDARAAIERLRSAVAVWTATQGTVEQARRAWEIASLRYREGLSTQTELSEARLLREQAEAYRATAARDAEVARARLALLRDLPLAGADVGQTLTTAAQGLPSLSPAPAQGPSPVSNGSAP